MHEYLDNGVRLGWLIDAGERKVSVYDPQSGETCLEAPESLTGDPVLPGFVFESRSNLAAVAACSLTISDCASPAHAGRCAG
ncbi:MAG: Uma2 family endonuclease [Blastocatellia bacterium]